MPELSKKFNNYMAAGYTIVFAVGMSVVLSVVMSALGMLEFKLDVCIFETIAAIAVATLITVLLPLFEMAEAFGKLCKAVPPKQSFILCMSSVICAVFVPCLCLFFCMLQTYSPGVSWNFRIVFSTWIKFLLPMYLLALILAQLFGKLIFKCVVKILGDEAFDKPVEPFYYEEKAEVKPEPEEQEEVDTSVEAGGFFHGKWDVINTSPAGKNKLVFDFEQRNDRITGTVTQEDGRTATIKNGVAKDNKFEFDVKLKLPFGEIDLHMTGDVTNDTFKGISKMTFGESPIEGTRI